jgi:hypothetical protein
LTAGDRRTARSLVILEPLHSKWDIIHLLLVGVKKPIISLRCGPILLVFVEESEEIYG